MQIHATTIGNKGVRNAPLHFSRILPPPLTLVHFRPPSRSRHPTRLDSIYLAIKSSVFLNVRFGGSFRKGPRASELFEISVGKGGSAIRYWDVKYSPRSSDRSILLDLIIDLLFFPPHYKNTDWHHSSDQRFTHRARNFRSV